MKNMVKNFFKQHGLGSKVGFGITEVLIASMVLGFMCVALNKLQSGNHETFLRIRGRDGAIEVAQRVLDSLKAIGCDAVVSNSDSTKNLVTTLGTVDRTWDRGLGGHATIVYTPEVTVFAVNEYVAKSKSSFESIPHVYAKQVDIKVSWPFKGSVQSITVSGVVR